MDRIAKIVMVVVIAGLVTSFISKGGYNSLNFNDIVQKTEKLISSTDFGPLNGAANNMKEAYYFLKEETIKLIDLAKSRTAK